MNASLRAAYAELLELPYAAVPYGVEAPVYVSADFLGPAEYVRENELTKPDTKSSSSTASVSTGIRIGNQGGNRASGLRCFAAKADVPFESSCPGRSCDFAGLVGSYGRGSEYAAVRRKRGNSSDHTVNPSVVLLPMIAEDESSVGGIPKPMK